MQTRIKGSVAALLLACAMTAHAQNGPDGNGNNGPDNGGGPPSMSQMRDMMLARVQKQLDMPDDAFTAIKPQLEHVMELKRDENAGMGRPGGPGGGGQGGGGPGGGQGGPGGGGPPDMNGGGGGGGGPQDMNGGGGPGGGGPGGGGQGGPPEMNGGGGGPGGGGGGPDAQQPQSEVRKAQRDLRTTVRDTSADNDTLKAKMQAYRDARAKNHADLIAAETQLKSVLSLRQEAVLLSMGILD